MYGGGSRHPFIHPPVRAWWGRQSERKSTPGSPEARGRKGSGKSFKKSHSPPPNRNTPSWTSPPTPSRTVTYTRVLGTLPARGGASLVAPPSTSSVSLPRISVLGNDLQVGSLTRERYSPFARGATLTLLPACAAALFPLPRGNRVLRPLVGLYCRGRAREGDEGEAG